MQRIYPLISENRTWIGRETYRCEDSRSQTSEIGEESKILGGLGFEFLEEKEGRKKEPEAPVAFL